MRAALAGLVLVSPTVAACTALLLALVPTGVQVRPEETCLEQVHGQAYRDYCARVGRWL